MGGFPSSSDKGSHVLLHTRNNAGTASRTTRPSNTIGLPSDATPCASPDDAALLAVAASTTHLFLEVKSTARAACSRRRLLAPGLSVLPSFLTHALERGALGTSGIAFAKAAWPSHDIHLRIASSNRSK